MKAESCGCAFVRWIGKVIFSDDGSAMGSGADDDVLDAAAGHVISGLTLLNSDAKDHGPVGPRVIEVYEPLLASGSRGAAVDSVGNAQPFNGNRNHQSGLF